VFDMASLISGSRVMFVGKARVKVPGENKNSTMSIKGMSEALVILGLV
jgi:hypothetical protein